VDQIISLENGAGFFDVTGDKGLQSVVHHGDGQIRHAGNIDLEAGAVLICKIDYAFSDVYSLVTHTLQVSIDLDAGDNQAQVDGHRLLHGQQVDGEFVDLALG